MGDAPEKWTPLAVNYFRHPKIIGITPRARLLHLAGFCYCQEHVTDGLIPEGALPVLAAEAGSSRAAAKELVDGGLWERVDGGWLVDGWMEWNRSADEIERRKADARDRKRRQRDKERGVTRDTDVTVTGQSRDVTPPPTPTPTETPPPPPPPVDNDLRSRVLAAAARAESRKAGKAGHAGYEAAIQQRLERDEADRLLTACSTWPEAPVDKLAGWVLGEDVRGLGMYR